MIKIGISQVEGLGDRLSGVTPEQMAAGLIKAVNETADETYALGRRTMLVGINLDDGYVQDRMKVAHATSKNPTATITAFGGREYLTALSHYGAMLETKDVNWSNDRIRGMGREFGPWPGWTERTGDKSRGIAADQKAYGVSVEVVKGKRRRIHGAVVMQGKEDTQGNPLVFRRLPGSNKKVENLMGPSVYQLFRKAIPLIEGQASEDLEKAVIVEAERGWLGAL